MKKAFVGIAVIVVVALGVVFGVIMSKKGGTPSLMKSISPVAGSKSTLAYIVPKDTAGYIGFYGLNQNWNMFKQSKFWGNITALQLWKDIDFPTLMKTFKDGFKTQTGLDLQESTIMELFGEQFAFAFFMNSPRQKSPSAVLLTKVGAKTKIITTLSNLTQQAQPNMEKIEYKGQSINHIKATAESPMDLSYVIVNDYLLIEVGLENKNINAIIDMVLSGDKTDSLGETSEFARVTDAKNGPYTQELYLNAKAVVSGLDTATLPAAFQDEAIKSGIKNSLGTVNAFGGCAKLDKGFYTKLIILPNFDTQNESLKKMWNAPPQKSKSMGMVPKDAILFSSSHSLDVQSLWSIWQEGLAKQNSEQANTIMTTIGSIESTLGVSIANDLLPVLGNEVGYMVSDVDVQGFIPIPKAAVFVKVKDAAAANSFLGKLIAGINKSMGAAQPDALPMLAVENMDIIGEKVNKVKINQFPIPGLTPCYAIINDQLIIATNSDTLTDIISVYKGKKESIRESANYAKVKDVFTDKNNQLSFINMEITMNKLVDICNWVIDLQKSTGTINVLNQDTILLITSNIVPFIKSFNSVKALAANTVYENGEISKTIIYRVEDF